VTEAPTPTGTLISLSAAADRIGISRQTLRNYVRAGRLTGYRIGTTLIRLDSDEVDALTQPMPRSE
jgi:excisionase family DNA binding protein